MDAIILMGADPLYGERTLKTIANGVKHLGERYVYDIWRYEIELFGKSIANYILDATDESSLLGKRAIVVPGNVERSEFFRGVLQGRVKPYIFMESGTRIQNVLNALEILDTDKPVMIICGDLPLVQGQHIDALLERYESFSKPNYIPWTTKTVMRDFPRTYLHVKDDLWNTNQEKDRYGNALIKEPNCGIVRLDGADITFLKSILESRKAYTIRNSVRILLEIAYQVSRHLLRIVTVTFLDDPIYIPRCMSGCLRTYANYHWGTGGKAAGMSDMKRLISIVAGVSDEQIVFDELIVRELSMDCDSVQDVYRIAVEMCAREGKPLTGSIEDKWRKVEQYITYRGEPLIDYLCSSRVSPEIRMDKEEFYSTAW